MTSCSCYRVTVEREDQLWTAFVEGLPSGAFGATDTERFADLDDMVRDLIATLTDAEPDSFDLTWRFVQNGVDYTVEIEQAHAASAALHEAEAAHEKARGAAVAAMVGAGLSQRAIGDALGLSYQRVGQLVRGRPADEQKPPDRHAG